jgi:antitoxin (DNA-binding transcriptional repressor) of toxin-antitoxin stability system
MMKVTITEFRRNLFQIVERVIEGETVEFVHHGATVRLVVPEGERHPSSIALRPGKQPALR